MNSKLVYRNEFEARMNTGSGEHPVWSLIGEGFTSFSQNKNPKEYTYWHFDEPVEYSDVVGYSPSFSFTADIHSDNPVIAELMRITDHELTGADARREIVVINKWDSLAPGVFRAYKRTYSIACGSSADRGDVMTLSGTMRVCGRLMCGAYDSSTNQFFTEVKICGS